MATIQNNPNEPVDKLLYTLKERAKELNCLFEIEELFSRLDYSLPDIMQGIVREIPPGLQYPDVCEARISYGKRVFQTPGYRETPWVLSVTVSVQDEVVGAINVCYTEERPVADEGPFLKEERKLLDTIRDRLERRILHERLKAVFEKQKRDVHDSGEWRIITNLLKRTDPKLLTRISRKMLNFLSLAGIEEADLFLERFNPVILRVNSISSGENQPSPDTSEFNPTIESDGIFELAARHLSEKDILNNIQKWIKEDQSGFLVRVLENPGSSLTDIVTAIEKYHHLTPQGLELSSPRERAFRIALIRRILNDDPYFVQIAKQFIKVSDFFDLLHRIVIPTDGHGKLGGKGAGLFLASQILKCACPEHPQLCDIKVPKTWYITTGGLLNFVNYNELEEVVEYKYEDIEKLRQQYPYIVHVFKNCKLPPDIISGLSVALDDLGDSPLIVRSSSLLEDRMGTSFAGKYKSLFIANQGSKPERLAALVSAITEVYASIYAPDPIEYRTRRGLIDFHEEMGIMIQEVVGTKVCNFFFPAFAGVAFSTNEFRWSRRIRREDGLIRMVPGLGTRAVDRLSDDYPILISPGQPSLRVNVKIDEKVHYSPKHIDTINLITNSFETVELDWLLKNLHDQFPMYKQLVSIYRDGRIVRADGLDLGTGPSHPIVTFDGLIDNSDAIEQVWSAVKALQTGFDMPVDIEFAHDGSNLYLLQCRPQSYSGVTHPVAIPRDIANEQILFTANRFVSNGWVSDISHVVYIDPQHYGELTTQTAMLAVGRAVGKLNLILPKRKFILMGPGRWGSHGDIKLGVSVTYSDISNTAMLIEIARKQKEYEPELSFGTHFFQDLVEAAIQYLPLYPDNKNIRFNEKFFTDSENILTKLLPEFSELSDTIRVIDIPNSCNGLNLHVLMNAEVDEAMAVLMEKGATFPEYQSKKTHN